MYLVLNMEIQSVSNHLLIIYSLFSMSFLINWLRFQMRHPNLYPEDKFFSFIIILIITVFWPVALLLRCIIFFKKR